MNVDPKGAFSKDVGSKKILGVPILSAYNVRADISEDIVYKMVSAFYKNREKLAKPDPGFTPVAKDSSACRCGDQRQPGYSGACGTG